MKRIFSLLIGLVLTFTLQAVNAENWNLYLAYHNALENQPAGDEIYANFDGNLLAYHPEDGEIRFLSKLDGLNGRNIKHMGYSDTEKCLLLVYDNLQIDLVYPEDNTVVNIPQIKNSGIDGIAINSININGSDAVLAMNNGVAHINLHRQEVTGYYIFDKDIRNAVMFNNTIYAGTYTELFACSTADNMLDKEEWKKLHDVAFTNFVVNGDRLYGTVNWTVPHATVKAGFWILKDDGKNFQQISGTVFDHVYANRGKMVVASKKRMQIFNTEKPTEPEVHIVRDNQWKDITIDQHGLIWISDGYKGLQAYEVSGDSLKAKGDCIGNYGPRRDLCYYMNQLDDRLMIAGGRLDPFDKVHNPGTIMEFKDGKWSYFQEEGITEQTGIPYTDITCVIPDPKDSERYWAASGGTGLYEFYQKEFVQNLNVHNSALESAAGNNKKYVRVDGLVFDEKGYLWMVNNTQQDTILRARRPDGTWKGFYLEPLVYAPTCEKTLIDNKGRLWVASRRTVGNHSAGLLCFDYNGTFENTKDDIATYRSDIFNQDNKPYTLGGVYCMAQDKDNSIWVGTKVGLFVISNPDDWHKANFFMTQIKVPRNDGTNLADYLLSDMAISAITIDGAGRKWIGTESNGLYLVSPDGTEILEHFEESNTPLLSNYIYSLAANLETGLIMIGTDKGLCSYQSVATHAEPSLNKSNIKVYPNPVRPEYHGNIHVTGLTENAEVKVMTTSGEVVAMGTSTGGSFIWDARGGDGARVAPGIYYFMVATADGNKGVAAKIVIM